MVYALGVWWPAYPDTFTLLIWKVQASRAFIILSIFVLNVLVALPIGIFSVTCVGAGVCLLGIAGSFITTVICGSGTPAGTG